MACVFVCVEHACIRVLCVCELLCVCLHDSICFCVSFSIRQICFCLQSVPPSS